MGLSGSCRALLVSSLPDCLEKGIRNPAAGLEVAAIDAVGHLPSHTQSGVTEANLVISRAARFKRAMEIFDRELVHER